MELLQRKTELAIRARRAADRVEWVDASVDSRVLGSPWLIEFCVIEPHRVSGEWEIWNKADKWCVINREKREGKRPITKEKRSGLTDPAPSPPATSRRAFKSEARHHWLRVVFQSHRKQGR